jgi:DNA-3-methyladenine glycosylase
VETEMYQLLSRPSTEAAPLMLGWHLVSELDGGRVTVALTEVEAYAGVSDPASHAFRGASRRNQVMFGPAGRLYVYFSYGMHWCANVVTGPDGEASAVLLRSGRVVEGADLARRRRGAKVADRSLARGPACLTQALAVTRESNGVDLLAGGALRLEAPRREAADHGGTQAEVADGPRVGISTAADVHWRFWVAGDETVSAYRRSPRASAPGPNPKDATVKSL